MYFAVPLTTAYLHVIRRQRIYPVSPSAVPLFYQRRPTKIDLIPFALMLPLFSFPSGPTNKNECGSRMFFKITDGAASDRRIAVCADGYVFDAEMEIVGHDIGKPGLVVIKFCTDSVAIAIA